jgi:hypothetical protein
VERFGTQISMWCTAAVIGTVSVAVACPARLQGLQASSAHY